MILISAAQEAICKNMDGNPPMLARVLAPPTPVNTAITAAMAPMITPHRIFMETGASISSSDIPEVHTDAMALVLESAAVTKEMKVARTKTGTHSCLNGSTSNNLYTMDSAPDVSSSGSRLSCICIWIAVPPKMATQTMENTVGTNRLMMIQSRIL